MFRFQRKQVGNLQGSVVRAAGGTAAFPDGFWGSGRPEVQLGAMCPRSSQPPLASLRCVVSIGVEHLLLHRQQLTGDPSPRPQVSRDSVCC